MSISSIYFTPPFPAFLPTVHATLNELNLLIATQVANNTGYQQAMNAGAVCGCLDGADLLVW